jgi:hypothetical protein
MDFFSKPKKHSVPTYRLSIHPNGRVWAMSDEKMSMDRHLGFVMGTVKPEEGLAEFEAMVANQDAYQEFQDWLREEEGR